MSALHLFLKRQGQGNEYENVLFSISFGMPKVNPRATTASRIIGFLSSDNGETGEEKKKKTHNQSVYQKTDHRSPQTGDGGEDSHCALCS